MMRDDYAWIELGGARAGVASLWGAAGGAIEACPAERVAVCTLMTARESREEHRGVLRLARVMNSRVEGVRRVGVHLAVELPALGGPPDSTVEELLTWSASMWGQGRGVLFHCVAGVSRSPAVMAGTLGRWLGQPPEVVLSTLAERRPHIMPKWPLVDAFRRTS